MNRSLKSSGKTDSLKIGLKLNLFSGLLRRLILSDSPLLTNIHCNCIHIFRQQVSPKITSFITHPKRDVYYQTDHGL